MISAGAAFAAAAIACALLEALALSKSWRRVEYVAKPAVILFLWAWLYTATALNGAAFWFGIGLACSLIGDVLLLWPRRFFVPGLAVFLLTHVAYIIGFNHASAGLPSWSLIVALVVGLSAARLLQRIVAAMRAQDQGRLVLPVVLYGTVITLMLLSALLTLSNTDWSPGASLLVSLGALGFYASDVVLAWNRFVAPVSNGHLINIGLYHAGQIALIAGVVMQSSANLR